MKKLQKKERNMFPPLGIPRQHELEMMREQGESPAFKGRHFKKAMQKIENHFKGLKTVKITPNEWKLWEEQTEEPNMYMN